MPNPGCATVQRFTLKQEFVQKQFQYCHFLNKNHFLINVFKKYLFFFVKIIRIICIFNKYLATYVFYFLNERHAKYWRNIIFPEYYLNCFYVTWISIYLIRIVKNLIFQLWLCCLHCLKIISLYSDLKEYA